MDANVTGKLNSIKLIKHEAPHKEETSAIVIIERLNVFLTACDKMIKVWDLSTYELKLSKIVHDSYFSCMIYIPEKDVLITGGYDSKITKINTNWDVIQTQNTEGIKDGVRCLCFVKEKNWVITGCDSSVTVFEVDTFEIIKRLTDHFEAVRTVTAIPEKKVFVSGSFDRNIIVWSMEDFGIVRLIEGNGQYVRSLIPIPHLNSLISYALEENIIKLWDLDTWELKHQLKVDKDPDPIIYIKEFSSIISAEYYGTLSALSVPEFKYITDCPNIEGSNRAPMQEVAFLPSKNLLFFTLCQGDFRVYSIN